MQEFLNTRLFTLNEQDITVAQVVIAPLLVVFGFFALHWLGKKLARWLDLYPRLSTDFLLTLEAR